MAKPNVDIVIDCADPDGNEFCVCPGVPIPRPK